MITEHTCKGTLYGKTTRTFDIEDLADLRELKDRFPAEPLFYYKDACLSFRTTEQIKKETEGKTVTMQNKTVKTLYDYLKDKGEIKPLTNPYVFRCDCLRGYPNTYKIEWQTKTEYITAETKTNLWPNVTATETTAENEYAEHTVKPVKLIPLHPQVIKTNFNFDYARWYGGDITTYNAQTYTRAKEEFDLCIFQNKSLGH